MTKLKIFKSIVVLILVRVLISLASYIYQTKDRNSFSVCYAPDDCKVIVGAPKEATKTIIGYPKDYHKENSNAVIDIQATFDKGRFDEKAFYFVYKNKVYYFINTKVFTGFSEDAGGLYKSDAGTFELIDANFSKDKNNVYGRKDLETSIATEVIIKADSQTFTPLDWPYAKDKNTVFYLNNKIENADTGTFKILDNKICGQDKNNYYKDGQIVTEERCN